MADKKKYDSGRAAYEAYSKSAGWVSITGDALPDWEKLPGDVKRSWRAAEEKISKIVVGAVARMVAELVAVDVLALYPEGDD